MSNMPKKTRSRIGDSLTETNLERIYIAMSEIREIDRSQAFETYYNEVRDRLNELDRARQRKGKEDGWCYIEIG
jgi:hypothetical protein